MSSFFREKWRMAVQTLVQDDTNTPPVTPCIVRFASDHLRSHVLARSNDAQRRRAVSTSVPLVEQILTVVALLVVLFNTRHDAACPSQGRLDAAGFFLVLFVAFHADT